MFKIFIKLTLYQLHNVIILIIHPIIILHYILHLLHVRKMAPYAT